MMDFREYKSPLAHFLLGSIGLGFWYSLQFVDEEWLDDFPSFWVFAAVTLLLFIGCNFVFFLLRLTNLLTPLVVCRLEKYLGKKKEFRRKINEVNQEFGRYFEVDFESKEGLQDIDREFKKTFG
jgi:hypothetical protein